MRMGRGGGCLRCTSWKEHAMVLLSVIFSDPSSPFFIMFWGPDTFNASGDVSYDSGTRSTDTEIIQIRGNPGDEDEKRRGQMAEDQAVDFFARWLVPE